ncbi:MAG: hypothetical protein ABW278_02805 [Steroidobacteraceae bacterium]
MSQQNDFDTAAGGPARTGRLSSVERLPGDQFRPTPRAPNFLIVETLTLLGMLVAFGAIIALD